MSSMHEHDSDADRSSGELFPASGGNGFSDADAGRSSASDPRRNDELILSGGGAECEKGSSAADAAVERESPRRRRVRLPLILFLTTCLSTFWVGANHWLPIPGHGTVRQILWAHWQDGLTYMGCVLAILLAHEMGHFLATVRYAIPASFPYFIPFPISPVGTMGAVIGMDGLRADRRELFDIGLAGPLAGLVVAVPIMWLGIARLELQSMAYGPFALDLPLLARWVMQQVHPGYASENLVWFSQLNPYFMAGWVGFLITGLNMMPVSQLDGGHVVYTLFGRKAHWIARGLVVLAIVMVAVFGQWRWSPMILLVLFIGPDHPPTRDDTVPLGRLRTVLGWLAILIPVLCFPLRLIIVPG
jgi:hypothetical protein